MITDIFPKNWNLDIISRSIRSTISPFNFMRSFCPSRCSVYVKIPWIRAVFLFFEDKITRSIMRSIKVRIIFTTKPAFQSFQQNFFPLLQQSIMVYKSSMSVNADFISKTIQKLEVRVKKRMPRGLSRYYDRIFSNKRVSHWRQLGRSLYT